MTHSDQCLNKSYRIRKNIIVQLFILLHLIGTDKFSYLQNVWGLWYQIGPKDDCSVVETAPLISRLIFVFDVHFALIVVINVSLLRFYWLIVVNWKRSQKCEQEKHLDELKLIMHHVHAIKMKNNLRYDMTFESSDVFFSIRLF